MIDRRFLGWEVPPHIVEVERQMVRNYVHAIGESDPLYFDEQVARRAGYRDLPLPPSFPFTLYLMDGKPSFWRVEQMGAVIGTGYHGEVEFHYHAVICAGDRIECRTRVSDISDRKNGQLTLITESTRFVNQHGQHVADMRNVFVVVNTPSP